MSRCAFLVIALVLLAASSAFCADKQITAVGTLHCGTMDCVIRTAEGNDEPGFMPSSKEGKQILAAFKKCSKCEFTGLVDDKWGMVSKVISIKCVK